MTGSALPPVIAIPCTNVRCVRKNKITIGNVTAADTAISHAQLVEYVPRISFNPNASGYHDGLFR